MSRLDVYGVGLFCRLEFFFFFFFSGHLEGLQDKGKRVITRNRGTDKIDCVINGRLYIGIDG